MEITYLQYLLFKMDMSIMKRFDAEEEAIIQVEEKRIKSLLS
jgi:hypothetical protein